MGRFREWTEADKAKASLFSADVLPEPVESCTYPKHRGYTPDEQFWYANAARRSWGFLVWTREEYDARLTAGLKVPKIGQPYEEGVSHMGNCPHVNVGTMGQDAAGKTTLAAAIMKVLDAGMKARGLNPPVIRIF